MDALDTFIQEEQQSIWMGAVSGTSLRQPAGFPLRLNSKTYFSSCDGNQITYKWASWHFPPPIPACYRELCICLLGFSVVWAWFQRRKISATTRNVCSTPSHRSAGTPFPSFSSSWSQNQEPRAPQILNMPSWDMLPPALSTVRSYGTVPSCVCSLRSRNKPIGSVVC